jgi:geranylgeranylglycerol-phosphate geranylgeranyltransferase
MTIAKIYGLFRLFRFELPLAAGTCVVLAQLLALGDIPSVHQIVYGFLSVFCISATALIHNDFFDIETDRINSPLRPLPSGVVTKTEALILSIFVAMIGFIFSFMLSKVVFGIVLFVWVVIQ